MPEYARWDRLALFSRLQEGLLPRTVVDPDWDLASGSVSAANDEIRQGLTSYYAFAFPDPALRAKVLPDYPFGAKRMVVDSGVYSSALAAPNVTLETEAIAEIGPSGVVLRDGRTVDHDVIVYGTGFQASRFLTPMRVVGRGGVDLHERWDGDARAHLGLTVPGFPNLFLMYGPNTNIVVNGSIIYFSECQAHYIAESLRLLLVEGRGRDGLSPRGARRLQRHDRHGDAGAGVGGVGRLELVQERARSGGPELALQPVRLLAADQGSRPRRLPPAVVSWCATAATT